MKFGTCIVSRMLFFSFVKQNVTCMSRTLTADQEDVLPAKSDFPEKQDQK